MEKVLTVESKETSLKNAARIFCIAFMGAAIIAIVILAIFFFKEWNAYNEKLYSDAAAGMDPSIGLVQYFKASDLQELAKAEAIATYGQATVSEKPTLIENVKSTILSKYTLHGDAYVYNFLPVFMGWPYLYSVIGFIVFILFQLYVLIRVNKAKLTELYCMVAIMFMTLNIPSAIFLLSVAKQKG